MQDRHRLLAMSHREQTDGKMQSVSGVTRTQRNRGPCTIDGLLW
jgi:hypothetical protein